MIFPFKVHVEAILVRGVNSTDLTVKVGGDWWLLGRGFGFVPISATATATAAATRLIQMLLAHDMLVIGLLAAALDLTDLTKVDRCRIRSNGRHHALQAGGSCCRDAGFVGGVLQVGVVSVL